MIQSSTLKYFCNQLRPRLDCYKILHSSPNNSQEQIHYKYKLLLQSQNENKDDLQSAFTILSDPKLRAEYDKNYSLTQYHFKNLSFNEPNFVPPPVLNTTNSSIYPLCLGIVCLGFGFLVYKSDQKEREIFIPEPRKYFSSVDAMETWRDHRKKLKQQKEIEKELKKQL